MNAPASLPVVTIPELNRRWSLADMDKITALARTHKASVIAEMMRTTTPEILRLCRRNNIVVRME